MPTENNNPEIPQTNTDPKEYIRNLADLGTNMQAKSQVELERANATLEIGQSFKNEGEEQIKIAKGLEKLDESVMKNTTMIASPTERLSEDTGENEESLDEKVKDLLEAIGIAKKNLEKAIPNQIRELIDQNPEVEKLREEIKGLFASIEGLNEAKEYIKKSKTLLDKIPNEISDSLENIREEAQKLKIQGKRNLEVANSQRYKKVQEVAENAEKNLESMERTIGRESSEKFAKEGSKEIGGFVAGKDVQATQDLYNNAYTKKVETRISNNMQEQGRTKEEIEQAINNAKQRINDAIKQEKEKTTQTITTPSPYTALQP